MFDRERGLRVALVAAVVLVFWMSSQANRHTGHRNIASPKRTFESEFAFAQKELAERKTGVIVTGTVVVEGSAETPDKVTAQVPILPDGRFVTLVKDLERPLGFRLHGYEPVDFPLKGHAKAELVQLGEIRIRPLSPQKLSSLFGKIAVEGGGDLASVNARISLTQGPINHPSNGYSPAAAWREIPLPLDTQGAFHAEGFSPTRYEFRVSAPGYVPQWQYVDFSDPAGGSQRREVSTLLEKAKPVSVRYQTSLTQPFHWSAPQSSSVTPGGTFKALGDQWSEPAKKWGAGYGNTFSLDQKRGQAEIRAFYAPAEIVDLGPGKLEDFRSVGSEAKKFRQVNEYPIEKGHVYLMNHGHFKYWILFEVEKSQ